MWISKWCELVTARIFFHSRRSAGAVDGDPRGKSKSWWKKESHKYEIQTCICVWLVLHTRRIFYLIPADPRSTKIEFFELSEINMHGILNMHYLHCKLFQWIHGRKYNENLYWWIQLDMCHCSNTDCYCRGSVKREQWNQINDFSSLFDQERRKKYQWGSIIFIWAF